MQGSRDISLLHPGLQSVIVKWRQECERQNLPVLITETFRTVEYQNWLFAQGRTRVGTVITNANGSLLQSAHQWGVAFDFCRNVRGQEYDDKDGFFGRVGAVGKSLGLTWGGDWRGFVDKPHFEMTELMRGASTAWLRDTYGTPQKFITTWSASDEEEEEQGEQFMMRLEYEGQIYTLPSILYEGYNYPQLRPLMEILKIPVGWNENTQTVKLG